MVKSKKKTLKQAKRRGGKGEEMCHFEKKEIRRRGKKGVGGGGKKERTATEFLGFNVP